VSSSPRGPMEGRPPPQSAHAPAVLPSVPAAGEADDAERALHRASAVCADGGLPACGALGTRPRSRRGPPPTRRPTPLPPVHPPAPPPAPPPLRSPARAASSRARASPPSAPARSSSPAARTTSTRRPTRGPTPAPSRPLTRRRECPPPGRRRPLRRWPAAGAADATAPARARPRRSAAPPTRSCDRLGTPPPVRVMAASHAARPPARPAAAARPRPSGTGDFFERPSRP
jgi:hypothetical protein